MGFAFRMQSGNSAGTSWLVRHRGTFRKIGVRKFCQYVWRAYWQCGGVLLKGPESSGAYGEIATWICGPCSCTHGREILPDIQTNARLKRFLGTKRGGSAECSDHPAAVMAIQEKNPALSDRPPWGGRSSPHQETEAWPQPEHGTPVFQCLRRLSPSRNFAA